MTLTTDPTPTEPDAPHAGTPGPRRRHLGRTLAAIAGTVVVVVALAWLTLRWLQPHPYSGLVMQAPTAAPAMDDLVDTGGAPIDLAGYGGEVVLVYFGYTNCPDVCPTTLAQVVQARRRLSDSEAERVRVLVVTVDPDRDTPGVLADYVASFDSGFVGVTGDVTDIERVASTYGVFFAPEEADPDGGYDMAHTASLLGIDTEGRLRIVWPSSLTPDGLAADLRELL